MTTLSNALDSFLLAKEADGATRATLKWYRSAVGAFVAAHQGEHIASVTTNQIREYIVGLKDRQQRYANAPQRPEIRGGLSQASIAGHVRGLHAFWAWIAVEYSIANPMRNIKRHKPHTAEPKSARMEDFVRIFNAVSDGNIGIRDRALLAMFADTGARLGGVASMQLNDLDFVKRRISVMEKGRKARVVYFTLFTAQLVRLWIDVHESNSPSLFVNIFTGDPLTESGISQVFRRLKARAGVTGRVNPHSFRHNFARQYIENGGEISTLAKLLGHTNITTTAAYYAVFTPDELADMHGRFTPMNNVDKNDLFRDG
jgi:integrase/recombinase XerD